MDKLDMQTKNIADENYATLAKLFPNALTETIVGYDEDGKAIVERAIDVDVLRQEISCSVVEGREERYQFTWPDKKKALLLANAPISSTLRPCKEESVDFDNTENIYIEGDNLEVLKLLHETYLGKIKMIYIDPPYNTGSDFIYADDFAESVSQYMAYSGQFDEEGNRLIKNLDSNGRFHTDWLNMMYSRIKLSRDLLREDGVIFISIDDNELDNVLKICKEIFGEQNYEATIAWRRRHNQPNDKSKMVAKVSENIIVFAKNSVVLSEQKAYHGLPLSDERIAEYRNPDNDIRGPWSTNPWKAATGRGGTKYKIVTPTGVEYDETWYGNEKTFNDLLKDNRVHWTDNGKGVPRIKIFLSEAQKEGQAAINFFTHDKFGCNQDGSAELEQLFGVKGIFDNPKPTKLLKALLMLATDENSIILDFFSGSASTANAVMLQNVVDDSQRKFILVQAPEVVEEKSVAYKNGFINICEIGKERIRRAGAQIYEENKEVKDFDIGFRVLKLDSSNMKDVYYNPSRVGQQSLFDMTDNIKEDRTPEDLLFQVMLDLGVLLSSKIEEAVIAGKKIFNVADGFLMACFDSNVTEEVVKAVAQQKPYYAVFRDSSMANDSVATNFDQIFATYSPETVRKVL